MLIECFFKDLAAASTAPPLLQSLLPLIGVIIGWLLKSGTDFLTASHRERVTRRKCTFYLLRAWKALLDYERFVSVATSNRPDIEEYEPNRASFAARFLSRISEDKDSLVTGIDMLATIDPTAQPSSITPLEYKRCSRARIFRARQ